MCIFPIKSISQKVLKNKNEVKNCFKTGRNEKAARL
jgi:hypothetical protein